MPHLTALDKIVKDIFPLTSSHCHCEERSDVAIHSCHELYILIDAERNLQ